MPGRRRSQALPDGPTRGDKVLLLSCKECGSNYFSAASGAECPDCGAELESGSPPGPVLWDVNAEGGRSNGIGARRSEFQHLWDLALGAESMPTENA
jgi:hypothetical protein